VKIVDKLIYDLILAECKPIYILDLYEKALEKNFMVRHEFPYAISNLLHQNLVSFEFNGNIVLKNEINLE